MSVVNASQAPLMNLNVFNILMNVLRIPSYIFNSNQSVEAIFMQRFFVFVFEFSSCREHWSHVAGNIQRENKT